MRQSAWQKAGQVGQRDTAADGRVVAEAPRRMRVAGGPPQRKQKGARRVWGADVDEAKSASSTRRCVAWESLATDDIDDTSVGRMSDASGALSQNGTGPSRKSTEKWPPELDVTRAGQNSSDHSPSSSLGCA